MTRPPRDMAASARARLLKVAEATGEEYNLLLVRYAIERLLFRLASSDYATAFVLKGALLFIVWEGHPHRATRDLDLLGFGEPRMERMATIFRSLCSADVLDDGVVFDPESVNAAEIRTLQEYGGIRVTLRARMGSAVVPVQVDVGFGDAMIPSPSLIEFPSLLGMPRAKLRAYAKETVVAEKVDAILRLGMLNTRLKDYYDLMELAANHDFNGNLLVEAIRGTLQRRGRPLPAKLPIGLMPEFAIDPSKQGLWLAFCRKGRLSPSTPPLVKVVEQIAGFVGPPLLAAGNNAEFARKWTPGSTWS